MEPPKKTISQKRAKFTTSSYAAHREHYDAYLSEGDQRKHAETWLREDTVNAWLADRLISTIDPILATFHGARWLTIGDGRYGNDAYYINELGGDAVPSDISTGLLEQAVRDGRIKAFNEENAEALSFEDESFDFVLCKESFHHFPRPWLAFYEMLRVARKAVLLIEPNDHLALNTPQAILYRKLKAWFYRWVLRRDLVDHEYEEVGNYVYPISRREIVKAALGVNYPAVAFRTLNTHYIPGVEHEELSNRSMLYRRIRATIRRRDLISRFGLKPAAVLAAIVFKEAPSQELETRLRTEGYDLIHFSGNPYLD